MTHATDELEYTSCTDLNEHSQRSDSCALGWQHSQLARYRIMLEALDAVLTTRAAPHMLLDIGCTTGTFTAMLARHFGPATQIWGVDLSEQGIAHASVRTPTQAFECLTIDQVAARFSSTMDVVVLLDVMTQIPAHERSVVLQRVTDMLRPGGLLLVASMLGQQPYLSAAELTALVRARFRIVSEDNRYFQPWIFLEKPRLHPANSFRWFRSRQNKSGSRAGDWLLQRLRLAGYYRLGRHGHAQRYAFAARAHCNSSGNV